MTRPGFGRGVVVPGPPNHHTHPRSWKNPEALSLPREKKTRVDECRSLDLKDLRGYGAFEGRPEEIRSVTWPDYRDEPLTVYYRRADDDSGPIGLGFCYRLPGIPEPVGFPVLLDWTPCNYGSRRPWFLCPWSPQGLPCRRRCRILYLPLGARIFACRECCELTYRSRQKHRNKFEALHRAREILDDFMRDPWPRSRRKLVRRLRQMERVNGALAGFLGERSCSSELDYLDNILDYSK